MKAFVFVIFLGIAGCSKNNNVSRKICCENCEEVRIPVMEDEIKPDFFARYPDGINGLHQFIKQNIKLPTDSNQVVIQGRVVVSFIINALGDVENIKIRSNSPIELNAEAIRVVTLLSGWCPAIKNGKPIAIGYLLPISF